MKLRFTPALMALSLALNTAFVQSSERISNDAVAGFASGCCISALVGSLTYAALSRSSVSSATVNRIAWGLTAGTGFLSVLTGNTLINKLDKLPASVPDKSRAVIFSSEEERAEALTRVHNTLETASAAKRNQADLNKTLIDFLPNDFKNDFQEFYDTDGENANILNTATGPADRALRKKQCDSIKLCWETQNIAHKYANAKAKKAHEELLERVQHAPANKSWYQGLLNSGLASMAVAGLAYSWFSNK